MLLLLVGADGEHDRMSDLDGLGYRSRLLGVLMTIFMLSLGGFPPLVGFWGKLSLFIAGVASGWTWLVVIAVLTSVMSIYYYLRVVYHVWLSDASERRLFVLSPVSVAAVVVPGVLSLAMIPAVSFVLNQGLAGAAQVLKPP